MTLPNQRTYQLNFVQIRKEPDLKNRCDISTTKLEENYSRKTFSPIIFCATHCKDASIRHVEISHQRGCQPADSSRIVHSRTRRQFTPHPQSTPPILRANATVNTPDTSSELHDNTPRYFERALQSTPPILRASPCNTPILRASSTTTPRYFARHPQPTPPIPWASPIATPLYFARHPQSTPPILRANPTVNPFERAPRQHPRQFARPPLPNPSLKRFSPCLFM